MTSYEKIKAACIAANPEIVELKFGCLIRDYFKGDGVVVAVQRYEGESDCYDVCFYKIPEPSLYRSPRNHNWDILGHPIRLADVLVVLQKEIPCIAVNGLGYFLDLENRDGDAILQWDMNQDNLSLQSRETQDAIANLLS